MSRNPDDESDQSVILLRPVTIPLVDWKRREAVTGRHQTVPFENSIFAFERVDDVAALGKAVACPVGGTRAAIGARDAFRLMKEQSPQGGDHVCAHHQN